jgi:hypothetical protein
MRGTKAMLKRVVKSATEALGYTVVRNERVQQAWTTDVKTVDMETDQDFASLYAQTKPYTMTSMSRMYALYKATEYIVRQSLAGDIVECGVWRGGSSMLVALALGRLESTDRTLYLYDTFAGMSQPSERDINLFGEQARRLLDESSRDELIWAYATLGEVRANLHATSYPAERLRFVQGKVENTLPAEAPERIALLRLDTDWYEPTHHELEHLFPRLVEGGVLLLDDYGHWAGARAAVDEYFGEHGISMLLNRIDYTGRIGVKLTPGGRIAKEP